MDLNKGYITISKVKKSPFKYPRLTDSEITPKELEIFEVIKKWPGVTVTEIAEYLERDRTTVEPKVKSLEKRGLIMRKQIKIKLEDGRVFRGIGLYPRGGNNG